MNTEIKAVIEAEIVRSPFTTEHRGNEVFPTLDDCGWDFRTACAVSVPVVVTPDGMAIVGEPDEDGILWRAGVALVLVNGDVRQARENSLSFTPGCRPGWVSTDQFKVVRGFGQTPILACAQPVLVTNQPVAA